MASKGRDWNKEFKEGYKNVSFRQIAEYLHDVRPDRFEYYKAKAASGEHISKVRNEFYEEFFAEYKPEKKQKVSISAFEFND